MKKLIVTASALLFLLSSMVSAQWTIYECNELPSQADPAWYPEGDGATVGVEDWFYVVNDPVIPGNKLLLFEELEITGKESYAVKWNATKDGGATAVWRMRASDNLLALIQTVTDSNDITRFAEVEVRNGWIRESVRIEYNLRAEPYSGYGLHLGQSFQKGKQQSAANYNFDQTLTDWHIFRMTILGTTVTVYLDEDPTPVVIGESPTLDRMRYLRIGDKQPNVYMGTLYDWVIWDDTGAYPPKQGTPIPRNLVGWNTGIEDEYLFRPKDFVLYPNFPNPFNPHTTIQFELVKAGYVSLTVYDVTGRIIRRLMDEDKGGGRHQITWNGQDDSGLHAAAGVYVYELRYEGMNKRGKMMLLK